jgi:hypothetical protein
MFKFNTVSVSFSACRCSSVVFSSKVGREKKKRVWKHFCAGYLQHSLLLSACCYWRRYLCRSQEWALHCPGPAGFVYSESCVLATATSFPLSKHTQGGDTVPAFSGLHVYLQFMWEVGLPPVLWSFPPSAFLLLVAVHAPLVPPECQAWPGLFIYSSIKDSPPPPLFGAQGAPTLFATYLYCSYCLLISFSFFPGWGVGLSRELCWSGPGLSVEVLRTT